MRSRNGNPQVNGDKLDGALSPMQRAPWLRSISYCKTIEHCSCDMDLFGWRLIRNHVSAEDLFIGVQLIITLTYMPQ